ncbi:hypothetical protein K438DRAFT_1752597 [Mycena galopus ATCC 62051]|nr:hypothetical protein K438DRAFT_1752597 [Mycena galopus ATCC 62051]
MCTATTQSSRAFCGVEVALNCTQSTREMRKQEYPKLRKSDRKGPAKFLIRFQTVTTGVPNWDVELGCRDSERNWGLMHFRDHRHSFHGFNVLPLPTDSYDPDPDNVRVLPSPPPPWPVAHTDITFMRFLSVLKDDIIPVSRTISRRTRLQLLPAIWADIGSRRGHWEGGDTAGGGGKRKRSALRGCDALTTPPKCLRVGEGLNFDTSGGLTDRDDSVPQLQQGVVLPMALPAERTVFYRKLPSPPFPDDLRNPGPVA